MSARRKKRVWPWLILLALLVGVGIFLMKRGKTSEPPLDPALLVTVKRGELAIEILEVGKVMPREKVELKSKVAGQVLKVLVEEGAQVKEGELLLVLDPIDYQREVARAEVEVAQARGAIAFAKINVDRKKVGVTSDVTPAQELDAANYELSARTLTLQAAQVALGAAQDRLRYTKIFSPMAGTVIQRGIQPGEVVTPGVQSTFDGKALLTVADLSTLIVKVDLNQIDVAKVRLGFATTLTLDALPGKTYEAKIKKIAPASIKPPGKDIEVFPVEAEIATADSLIKPGMTADVRIHVESKKDVLSIPIEAVLKEDGKSFVIRVTEDSEKKGQKKDKVEVTLGARNDRSVELVSGIEDGAQILINPGSAADNETKI